MLIRFAVPGSVQVFFLMYIRFGVQGWVWGVGLGVGFQVIWVWDRASAFLTSMRGGLPLRSTYWRNNV